MICKAMDILVNFGKSLPLKTYRLNSFRKWSWLTSICSVIVSLNSAIWKDYMR